ncbi:MAG: hypothetical protein LJE70_07745 [Chromatiaceae bacterium]|nr:hypothetical protein [Chromatiaceae bacterium]
MPGTGRLLWILVALLFVAVALVAWIKVGRILDPEAVLVAPLRGDCDLRKGPCEAVFPNGATVAFEMTPRHIPAVQPLELSVRTEGIDARSVAVDFSGVDMYMGFNRMPLDPVGPDSFTGSGMLPVCVRARMTWEAKVLLHTDSGLMAAPFRFDTYLPGREPSVVTKEASPE